MNYTIRYLQEPGQPRPQHQPPVQQLQRVRQLRQEPGQGSGQGAGQGSGQGAGRQEPVRGEAERGQNSGEGGSSG